jgi:hypothetical protein
MSHGGSAKGKRGGGPAVCIGLSHAQVEEVVRAAGPDSGIFSLLQDLGAEPRQLIANPAELPAMTDPALSRSMLSGLLVLACFTSTGTERRVKDVADQLHMSPSTVHRFIRTLKAVGLLGQNLDTRAYCLVHR